MCDATSLRNLLEKFSNWFNDIYYDKLNEKSLYTPAKFFEMDSLYSCWFHAFEKLLYNFKEKFQSNDLKG